MKTLTTSIAIVMTLLLCGCASSQTSTSGSTDTNTTSANYGTNTSSTATGHVSMAHRFATKSEGNGLRLSNEKYFAGFSQNDLDFRMQKTGATMEEYQSFAAKQVLDFTDEEKAVIDERLTEMTQSLVDRGLTLPPLEEIVFVKTTMAEECYAGAYTHGTTVFISADLLDQWVSMEQAGGYSALPTEILWHEIFHCLTRSNPDFRADMYKLIHFSVHEADFELPPSVMEYHISNPDVEHHDYSATFSIGGRDVECFVDFVTTRHFEKKGDSFFDCSTTALVPVDGTDAYYTPDQAANFYEVFGSNTDYVIDPEECMADNFGLALTFGAEGESGDGYTSPQIVEGILAYLSR